MYVFSLTRDGKYISVHVFVIPNTFQEKLNSNTYTGSAGHFNLRFHIWGAIETFNKKSDDGPMTIGRPLNKRTEEE